MRFLLLTSLVALICGISLAQEQDSRLPRCSTAQLAAASDMQKDFDPVLFSGADIESLDDLINFGAAHIAWRDEMWEHLPLCYEVFTYGFLLDQIAETLFMGQTLDRAQVDPDDHPYAERGMQYAKEMIRLERLFEEAAAVDAATAVAAPLRACGSDERLLIAGDIWADISHLLTTAFRVETLDDLLGVLELNLAWRAEVWSQLPPCAEAYEIAAWTFRFSSDVAKTNVLDVFGVSRSDNPYYLMVLEGLIRHSDYGQWVETAGRDYASLPSCADFAIDDALYAALKRHRDLAEVPHDTVEELPEFASVHIEWRESLWAALPELPACREAVETALLTLQITGDAAAVAALSTGGIGFESLSAEYHERVVSAGDRIGDLLQSLESAPEAGDANQADALAECSASDLDFLFDDLQGLTTLQQEAFVMQTANELIAYIQAYLEWRYRLWSALPGCAEAIQGAALMMQTLGDYAALIAMDLSGVPVNANYYQTELERSTAALNEWHSAVWAPIEGPVVTPGPTTTYFVDADGSATVRSCASSDCDMVGIAADGEALQIADDSGDWFEVYIGAGMVGYIQREMLSSEPSATE